MDALHKIRAAGFDVSLINDNGLAVTNASKLSGQQRDFIKTHKAEIIAELAAAKILQDIKQRTRKDAEQAATSSIRVYCYRTTEKPNSELVAIMPGQSLEEARESLVLRFGARLLDVYPMPGQSLHKTLGR